MCTIDLVTGRLHRIDRPGAGAVPVATVPGGTGAGALTWTPDGTLLVGYGADPRVLVGDAIRAASIAKFNPASGRLTPFVGGLSAANGLAVAANGAVLSQNDAYPYVSRAFANPGISRIPVRNPGAPQSLVTFSGRDVSRPLTD